MPIALGNAAPTRAHASGKPAPAATIDVDWTRYRTTGSVAGRNRLVSHYMATLVRPIAARLRASLPQQVELDDLVQQGYLGLVDAMGRFDPTRHTRFETFSRPRISGAIRDYLRSIDTVPRLTRSRAKQIQSVTDRFRKQHGHGPSEDELRRLLDVPETDFRRMLADRQPSVIVPFSHVQPEREGDDGDRDPMNGFEDPDPLEPGRIAERQDLQRWIVRGLDRRDRLIVILYYYEQMTMLEIGRVIGISESRVSQRIESILGCLRSRLVRTGAEEEFVFG